MTRLSGASARRDADASRDDATRGSFVLHDESSLREAEPMRRRESSRRSDRRQEGERSTLRPVRGGAGRSRTEREAEVPMQSSREHVSAYLGESTAGRVTTRSERRRSSTPLAGQERRSYERTRSTSGLTLVPDEAPARRRADEGELPTLRRAYVVDDYDYDYDVRGISGSQRRRDAIIGALCFIPETIGTAVLGLLGRMRAGGVAACVAIAIALLMLYAPTRDLYVTNRKLDALQETYDALLAENDSIRDELELLQTREGIENEARARGYVEPGETKVVVHGLPEDAEESVIPEEAEVVDTRPWYIRVMDVIFGYEPEG